jgi:hypothetical protein
MVAENHIFRVRDRKYPDCIGLLSNISMGGPDYFAG